MQKQPAGIGSHPPQREDGRAALAFPVVGDEVAPQPQSLKEPSRLPARGSSPSPRQTALQFTVQLRLSLDSGLKVTRLRYHNTAKGLPKGFESL